MVERPEIAAQEEEDNWFHEQKDEPPVETCPRCGRLITSSNPRVNKAGCQECQAGISLTGEIFLLDKKNPIVEFFKWLFGG